MPKEPVTHQKHAYDYVRGKIINLELKPGEYVTDTQIAERLKISRTPVREAFHRLEKEGLLVNEARKGWRVYSLNLEDIHEIFELKIAIEGMLIRKAAECKDDRLRQDLVEALDYMKKAATADNPNKWLQADTHLHNILFLMAENERADAIITNLNDQWHRLRLGYVAWQGRTSPSISEHEAFVTSVLANDADSAEQQIRTHLARVQDDLIRLVEKVVMPYTNQNF